MRVTTENYDEYLAIENCRYQVTFPSMNTESLEIICTRGVDIKGLAPYQYAPKCDECIGKECTHMEERKAERGSTWRTEDRSIVIEDTKEQDDK